MTTVQRIFDAQAVGWDSNASVREVAHRTADAIKREVPLSKDLTVLEFGCGTCLVTEEIFEHVGRLVAVDNSEGMCAVAEDKIKRMGMKNVLLRCITLESRDQLEDTFDLIFMNFTLHHIEFPLRIIKLLPSYLKKGGYLIIVDLLKSDVSELFHAKDKHEGIYFHGFDIDQFDKWARESGFDDHQVKEVYRIEKNDESGVSRTHRAIMLKARAKA